MGCAQVVAALRKRQLGRWCLGRLKDEDLFGRTLWRVEHFVGMSVRKDLRHVIGSFVHCVPEVVVPVSQADFDKRARHPEFIEFAGKRYLAARVAGSHLADTADCDDDLVVISLAQSIEQIYLGNFLKELGFRVRAWLVKTRSSDLQVKITKIIWPVFEFALHKKCRGLRVRRETGRQSATGDPDRHVRPQMRNEILADQICVWKVWE